MQELDISDVIAGIALLLSGFATWKTLQLNRGQERLNQLLTAREESEISREKRADVSANFYKLGPGKQRLKVFNRGRSVARDVMISFPESNELPVLASDLQEKFPIAIEPHQAVELIALGYMGMKRRHSIKIDWSDEAQNQNTKILDLTM